MLCASSALCCTHRGKGSLAALLHIRQIQQYGGDTGRVIVQRVVVGAVLLTNGIPVGARGGGVTGSAAAYMDCMWVLRAAAGPVDGPVCSGSQRCLSLPKQPLTAKSACPPDARRSAASKLQVVQVGGKKRSHCRPSTHDSMAAPTAGGSGHSKCVQPASQPARLGAAGVAGPISLTGHPLLHRRNDRVLQPLEEGACRAAPRDSE